MTGLGAGPGGPVAEMAAAFRAHVSPSAAAASTRSRTWAGWRAVLSWAAALRALGNILHMTLDAPSGSCWRATALPPSSRGSLRPSRPATGASR